MACSRQLQTECFLNLTLISILLPIALATSTASNMSLAGCPDKCGNISIPYPFGTRAGCYRDGFALTCNESTTPPKVFFMNPPTNIELIDINITTGEVRAFKFIGWVCYNQSNSTRGFHKAWMNLTSMPAYLFSNKRNKFTAIGCYTLAYIVGEGTNFYTSGCLSFCESLNRTTANGSLCNGLGCCQTAIPAGLSYYGVQWGYTENLAWEFNPCMYSVLVEEDWYKFNIDDLHGFDFQKKNQRGVPFVVDWAIRDNGTCQDGVEKSPNPACLSKHSSCYNTSNGVGYLCKCLDGFEGNPYLHDGCIDIDECNTRGKSVCDGECTNTKGGYFCSCPKGTHNSSHGESFFCDKDPEKFPYPARVAIFSVAGVAVFVGLCFMVGTHRQHKKHMKEKQAYQRYYEMMNNHLRVFSKQQIDIATNNFSETNIIGRGGQGNVYKGSVDDDNQVVAIKKAKKVEETQRGEFVNEIILLSQLNHKNIVRLLGCCLEDKIPMLVYEFFPNRTLFDLLHSKTGRRPISLGTRLKIAMESAVALDYLHSAIVRSIIHGDVKSANILLDADYTAKVSDFGASSVVPVNEMVELVHFSHGYLDPECLYTQIITKNSDVYSFGVVLLELVTRKEAIFVDDNGEKQSLATCFLSKERKNEHPEILDAEIVNNGENVMEVLDEICEIAVQCLSPKGQDRPTMKHVAEELQKLVRFYNRPLSRQIDEEEMESLLGEEKFSSMSDASGFHSTQYSAVLEITTGAPR